MLVRGYLEFASIFSLQTLQFMLHLGDHLTLLIAQCLTVPCLCVEGVFVVVLLIDQLLQVEEEEVR